MHDRRRMSEFIKIIDLIIILLLLLLLLLTKQIVELICGRVPFKNARCDKRRHYRQFIAQWADWHRTTAPPTNRKQFLFLAMYFVVSAQNHKYKMDYGLYFYFVSLFLARCNCVLLSRPWTRCKKSYIHEREKKITLD